jgi:hypothetical protein
MRSYDYDARRGVEEISWERWARLTEQLAERLAAEGIEAVVGIARAGLLPAAAVACFLGCDLYPVRLTRRAQDQVVSPHPVWKVGPPAEVTGRRVAVVDEIADTGETLHLAAAAVRERGAVSVRTAVLVTHTWADPTPDIALLRTDALVVFPWNRLVDRRGTWRLHPEIAEALERQRHRSGEEPAR